MRLYSREVKDLYLEQDYTILAIICNWSVLPCYEINLLGHRSLVFFFDYSFLLSTGIMKYENSNFLIHQTYLVVMKNWIENHNKVLKLVELKQIVNTKISIEEFSPFCVAILENSEITWFPHFTTWHSAFCAHLALSFSRFLCLTSTISTQALESISLKWFRYFLLSNSVFHRWHKRKCDNHSETDVKFCHTSWTPVYEECLKVLTEV